MKKPKAHVFHWYESEMLNTQGARRGQTTKRSEDSLLKLKKKKKKNG